MDADWGAVPATTWINAVFVAIGPTAVANLFYYRGVGAVGPASASIMMFMVPAVGTLCSYLFLGETFGAVQAIGAVGPAGRRGTGGHPGPGAAEGRGSGRGGGRGGRGGPRSGSAERRG